jgi:CDP-paratose synthetase
MRQSSALRVLLTGGTGFLGSNLLRRFCDSQANVVLLKRSTSSLGRIQDLLPSIKTYDLDRVELAQVFSENQFDLILHCATDYGRKQVEPTQLVEANLILPLSLLQWAEKCGVPTFVNTDTILDKRVSHYSLSKRQFFDWLKVYSGRLACINVALEHFYGPDDDETKFVSSMITSLIRGEPRIELTPGLQKRDFIYIDDVVSAFSLILAHAATTGPGLYSYEIGSGERIEIRQLVTLIQRLSGNERTELGFGSLPYRENEVMESNVDLRALQGLGWQPLVSLKEGLTRTIEFHLRKILAADAPQARERRQSPVLEHPPT